MQPDPNEQTVDVEHAAAGATARPAEHRPKPHFHLPSGHTLSHMDPLMALVPSKDCLSASHGLDIALTSELGFFGAIPRIWGYKPSRVHGWLALFTLSDMTVFSGSKRMVVRIIGYVGCVMLIANTVSDSFFTLYLASLSYTVNASKFVIGIVIGTFVSLVLSRWFARRQQYGGAAGKARLLAIKLAALTDPPRDSDMKDLSSLARSRAKLSRWLLLSLELAWLRANGNIGSTDVVRLTHATPPPHPSAAPCRGSPRGLCESVTLLTLGAQEHYLSNLNLLGAGEWELLQKPVREAHTIAWSWIEKEIWRLVRRGFGSPQLAEMASSVVSEIQGKADMMQMGMDWDIPYPFKHLIHICVEATLFFHAFEIASLGFENRAGSGDVWFCTCFLNMLVAAFLCTLLTGFLDMHIVLHSPFGRRRIDIPHEALFGVEIRETVTTLLHPHGLAADMANDEDPHHVELRAEESSLEYVHRRVSHVAEGTIEGAHRGACRISGVLLR